MAYSAAEYERKLNSVFGRHPQVKVEPMMHNERLGYESHEKESLKALEHQQQQKVHMLNLKCMKYRKYQYADR